MFYYVIVVWLISSEYISCINLLLNIVKTSVIAIGDDCLALLLECSEVVHHATAEEGTAVVECGFVDDDFGTFGLDAFHHALYRRLAEVVAV